MATLIWTPEQITAPCRPLYDAALRGPRIGCMVHYDGSGGGPHGDRNGLAWFNHPDCKGLYQVAVTDGGKWAQLAPDSARAYHAGVCRSSDPKRLPYEDGNSAFFGVAALTNEHLQVTEPQMLAIAWKIRGWFHAQGWDPEETYRIVGHDTEAWPRGRKIDPTGPNRLNPILSIEDIRYLVPRIGL